MRFLFIISLLIISLLIAFLVKGNNFLGLPTIEIPADNLQSKDKIELGREFFNERRFSAVKTTPNPLLFAAYQK